MKVPRFTAKTLFKWFVQRRITRISWRTTGTGIRAEIHLIDESRREIFSGRPGLYIHREEFSDSVKREFDRLLAEAKGEKPTA